ncbi:MAG TPA: FAD-binding and (Fe-S)-binding domain-containing protein [Candidatus Polarisedimenticolaceae bacterium]|nr:FAD-binding and (Fe-S)-binding domain-containing protein [Candidatus Polarisedimenticolaceae bacterium]
MSDARALESELRRRLSGEVRFDDGTRALYATDASNYRQVPIAVVFPRDTDDLLAALDACREAAVPVLPRGAGTSLAGQCCNVAVVLDLSRHLHRILEIDPEARLARVQPGVVLDHLRREAAPHGLTFGPDPATHRHCTLGGMLGNDSCGVHSVVTGRTSHNVLGLDVVTGDGLRLRVGKTSDTEADAAVAGGGRKGEIYAGLRALAKNLAPEIDARFPKIPRRVSGYGLDALLPEQGFDVARALVGTEGTCATWVEATLRLVPGWKHRALVLAGFPDVPAAADHVPAFLEMNPIGLEGIDHALIERQAQRGVAPAVLAPFAGAGAWLLLEVSGDTEAEAAAKAERAAARARREGALCRVLTDPAAQAAVWEVREGALGATAFLPDGRHAWEGWEDSAVAPARLGSYLRGLQALLRDYRYEAAFYGHFGDGCVHVRITFDLETSAGVGQFRSFMEDAADLVVAHGGSLSGEHGDGQARGELLDRMYGAPLTAGFRAFKRLWDPEGRMNPGKVVDARPFDADLRLGPNTPGARPATVFPYREEGGFDRAVLRCVGVGRCRQMSPGTMCPSFRATEDERHSTRGRARLLHEMLRGEVVRGGWDDPAVAEALDLCLACKACAHECPAGVDLATWKAEFFHHHWKGRRRPRAAYAFGHADRWLRLAGRVPRLANAMTAALGPLLKAAAGIAPDREIPKLAPTGLHRWAAGRRAGEGAPVLLWADTWTEHLLPAPGRAAVEVLEAAGARVTLSPAGVCCGRPLYDWGMLDQARQYLRVVLDAVGGAALAGTPVVVLEPSCLSVFKVELVKLFPGDRRAAALAARATTLAGFLSGLDLPLRPLGGRALVQFHCHQQAVLPVAPEKELLRRLGVEATVLDAGCCGMAGAFGFRRDHAEVSRRIGELGVLPAVRRAGPDVTVVADGFSCREQVFQETGRRPAHLAELLRAALPGGE